MNWFLIILGFGSLTVWQFDSLAGLVGGETVTDNSDQALIGDEVEKMNSSSRINDLLNGTPSGDVVDGLSGDDAISGHRGSDNLKGGTGGDNL